MAFSRNDLKGVTQEEVSKLTKAMKDGQFRDHMDEYCKEVSDPAHRQEYIQYLEQLEARGEIPDGQQLLRSEPGCCVKTSIRFKNGQTQKLFINIVHSDRLDDFELRPAEGGGRHIHLPYSLSPPRPDQNMKGEYCMTADCAVSSRTFYQAMQNPHILKMIVDTACDGLGAQFLKGYEEVRKDFKLMENMKCKGKLPMPMSVRAELLKDKGKKPNKISAATAAGDAVTPSELKQMRAEAKAKRDAERVADELDEVEGSRKPTAIQNEEQAGAERIRVPKHRLIHSGSIDLTDYMESTGQPAPTTTTIPKTLRLVVELPKVKRSSDVTLEVTCNNVLVEVPDKYYLDLPLSYEVDDARGTAKFDKAKSELTLVLPVVPKPPIFAPKFGGDDVEMEDGCISTGGDCPNAEAEPEPPNDNEPTDSADWIDRVEVDDLQEESAPCPAVTEPPREILEFSSPSLQIARPEGEDSAERDRTNGEVEVEELADFDNLPKFVKSDSWDGPRQGYYFGNGFEGLGYYKDKRHQPKVKCDRPRTPSGAQQAQPKLEHAGPMVEEILPEPVATVPKENIPPSTQLYLQSTLALSRRIRASEVESVAEAEPSVECHQNTQNIAILIDVFSGCGLADLQLAVSGHRLSLTFCSKQLASRSTEPSKWTRHRFRRVLCGSVDPNQWHADLVDRGNFQPQLVIVLRKVRRGDVWPTIFDKVNNAVTPEVTEPWEAPVAEPETTDVHCELVHDCGDAGEPQDADELDAGIPRDSDELDVAPDESQSVETIPGRGAAAAAVSVSKLVSNGTASQMKATPAMIQSAAITGQSVLLQNRFMYELL